MSGSKSYVNNYSNRNLGRVGMPLGSCVQSSSSSGRFGGGSSGSGYSSSAYSTQKCYVDNASNRSIGRVGMKLGSHVVHKGGSSVSGSTHKPRSHNYIIVIGQDDPPPSPLAQLPEGILYINGCEAL